MVKQTLRRSGRAALGDAPDLDPRGVLRIQYPRAQGGGHGSGLPGGLGDGGGWPGSDRPGCPDGWELVRKGKNRLVSDLSRGSPGRRWRGARAGGISGRARLLPTPSRRALVRLVAAVVAAAGACPELAARSLVPGREARFMKRLDRPLNSLRANRCWPNDI